MQCIPKCVLNSHAPKVYLSVQDSIAGTTPQDITLGSTLRQRKRGKSVDMTSTTMATTSHTPPQSPNRPTSRSVAHPSSSIERERDTAWCWIMPPTVKKGQANTSNAFLSLAKIATAIIGMTSKPHFFSYTIGSHFTKYWFLSHATSQWIRKTSISLISSQ